LENSIPFFLLRKWEKAVLFWGNGMVAGTVGYATIKRQKGSEFKKSLG
jgi:hypothetical protein